MGGLQEGVADLFPSLDPEGEPPAREVGGGQPDQVLGAVPIGRHQVGDGSVPRAGLLGHLHQPRHLGIVQKLGPDPYGPLADAHHPQHSVVDRLPQGKKSSVSSK